MHPLNNGSQVTTAPTPKNRIGTPGFFSESNEDGSPSYPGADWFNAVIKEFQAALSSSGVAFDPDKFDHFSNMLATSTISSGNFTGAVFMFATDITPPGFLKCNGTEHSRTTYADLFAKIGTIYGDGDGSTTFNIPDARGYLPRFWDDGAGIDSGRELGSTQSDAIRNITGSAYAETASTSDYEENKGALFINNHGVFAGTSGIDGNAGRINFDASNVVPTANENRPKNIAFAAYIKY